MRVGRMVQLMARSMSSSAPVTYDFETLNVTRPKEFVVHVEVNRPEKRNAQNSTFYRCVHSVLVLVKVRSHRAWKTHWKCSGSVAANANALCERAIRYQISWGQPRHMYRYTHGKADEELSSKL